MSASQQAFRFDCGATWLNLLATRGRTFGARPIERLASVDRLNEWFEACELTPSQAPVESDVELAWHLREALRKLALATVSGEAPSPEAIATLSELLDAGSLRLVVEGRLRLEPPPTARAALARIARQAADHLTGRDRHALLVCPEDDCRSVFVDPSGRRHWCPSPACASRGRVRALRARRAAGEAS
jgi:predicted RNA-binding Zn ribbon-like protein